MTKEKIKDEVLSAVAKYLEEDGQNINPDADLYNEYGADSLDIVQIIMTIERKFRISIANDVCAEVRTAQEIIDETERIIFKNN